MSQESESVRLEPVEADSASSPDSPLIMPTETQPKWLTQTTRPSRISEWWRQFSCWAFTYIRPRRSIKYYFAVAAVLYVTYCFIRGSPLFASRLPSYSGPYDVGAVDIEVPLEKPRRISETTFKGTDEPAFEHETTLFTLYYPVDKAAKAVRPRHPWIARPIGITAEGFAKFAHVNNFIVRPIFTFALWAIAGSVSIPAKVDAPLLPSTQESEIKFPVMVFSHGMASSRTDYTHYIGELASQGHVVAAIEHRDGSCPGTVIKKHGQKDRTLIHFKEGDLTSIDTSQMKKEQLAFRDAEIFDTIKILYSINEGKGAGVFASNPRNEGATLEGWTSRLNLDQLSIGGHSYGATGALQALKSAPNVTPAIGGIILDAGKESGPLNPDIDVPILVINSNSWSSSVSLFFGRPHFDTVRDIVLDTLNRTGAAWFFTSLGTSHPSVTDAPLLEPWLLSWTTGARMNTEEGLREYVKVSSEFLNYLGTKKPTGLLKEPVTHEEYGTWVSDKRKAAFPKSLARLWEVHVSPE